MLLVLTVAAAAALVVAAYARLRQHSPETGIAGLRAVRDLADVVIVCVRAIEGVLDVLARPTPLTADANDPPPRPRYHGWRHDDNDVDDASDYEDREDEVEYDAFVDDSKYDNVEDEQP